MSAPDTNLKKQKRRHRGPIIGITAVLVVVAVLLLWMFSRTVSDAPEPAAESGPAEEAVTAPVEGEAAEPQAPALDPVEPPATAPAQ